MTALTFKSHLHVIIFTTVLFEEQSYFFTTAKVMSYKLLSANSMLDLPTVFDFNYNEISVGLIANRYEEKNYDAVTPYRSIAFRYKTDLEKIELRKLLYEKKLNALTT